MGVYLAWSFCVYRIETVGAHIVTLYLLLLLQGAWLLINIALFTYQYWNFQATDKFYYMRIRTRVRTRQNYKMN